jgi:hypothetical protein
VIRAPVVLVKGVGRVPVGSIIITPVGEVLRVRPGGDVDEVLPGGWPHPGHAHATARRVP